MKKNRVKNVFLSIFLILFIVGSLLLIIKSIDYSKKISKRKDVNSVKDKKEILKNNDKNNDKTNEKKESNYEDSEIKRDENETINENIKDVNTQTEKPKTIKKSDYSLIEDMIDPEVRIIGCLSDEKLIDHKCYKTEVIDPVTEYYCDDGNIVSNKCEIEDYDVSDIIMVCDGSSSSWSEENIDKYCKENNKERNQETCPAGFSKITLYGESMCYKIKKRYIDAKLKTECPKPYKMNNDKCTYTEVTNQKVSFCPDGYNYVVIDNKNKCVKYKN